jgi:hypothetical protein
VKTFEYFVLATLGEAVARLAEKGDRAPALAGGTDLIVQLRRGAFSADDGRRVSFAGFRASTLRSARPKLKESVAFGFISACVFKNFISLSLQEFHGVC